MEEQFFRSSQSLQKNENKQQLEVLKNLDDKINFVRFFHINHELILVGAEHDSPAYGEYVSHLIRSKYGACNFFYLEKITSSAVSGQKGIDEFHLIVVRNEKVVSYGLFSERKKLFQSISKFNDYEESWLIFSNIDSGLVENIISVFDWEHLEAKTEETALIDNATKEALSPFELVPKLALIRELSEQIKKANTKVVSVLLSVLIISFFAFELLRPVEKVHISERLDDFKGYRAMHRGIPSSILLFDYLNFKEELQSLESFKVEEIRFEMGRLWTRVTSHSSISELVLTEWASSQPNITVHLDSDLTIEKNNLQPSEGVIAYHRNNSFVAEDLFVHFLTAMKSIPGVKTTRGHSVLNGNNVEYNGKISAIGLSDHNLVKIMKLMNEIPVYSNSLSVTYSNGVPSLSLSFKLVGERK